MKRYAGKINIEFLFILLQMLLYVIFLVLDLTSGSVALSKYIKFSVIILCFCYVLFYSRGASRSIVFCLQAAMFFTVISDLFILILDYYFYGVLTFILVQQFYSIRLFFIHNKMKNRKQDINTFKKLISRILIPYFVRVTGRLMASFLVCLLLYLSKVILDRLLIATVFYFICILTNVIFSIRIAIDKRGSKENVLFAIGMGLFLLCDINVGLFNLTGYLQVPRELYEVIYTLSSMLMWAFYAPAQVLIALSTKMYSKKV